MLVGQIRYPMESAQEVLGFYNEWIETVPDELAVYGFMGKASLPAHPDQQVNAIGLTPIFNGDARKGMTLIEPILKFKNIYINLYNMTLPDFEIFNGLTTVIAGRSGYLRSGYIAPKAMTPAAVEVLTNAMSSAPSPYSLLVWTHSGGKVSTVSRTDTAYWHREARFLYEVKAIWDAADELVQNVNWGYKLGQDMAPHTTGAYVNYIDPLLGDWQHQYYGGNYDRLCRIKEKWDPHRRFDFQQAVGSPFAPKTDFPPDLSPLFRTRIV
jgi:hypothetical protein